jgi:hypothetical protein
VSAQPLPTPTEQNGIRYVTVGIGEDEVKAFHSVAPNYNVRIPLAVKSGHYLSDDVSHAPAVVSILCAGPPKIDAMESMPVTFRRSMLRRVTAPADLSTSHGASPLQLSLLDQYFPVKFHKYVHGTQQGELGDDEVAARIPAVERELEIDIGGSDPPKVSPDRIADRTTRKESGTNDTKRQSGKLICD